MTLDNPANVLVVEDDEPVADLMRVYLEHEGYQVQLVGDGELALELATRQKPDLVVLDWMLPGRDGLDVCRELRRTQDIPVIIVTARAEESDRLKGLTGGADDYLVKPFSPRELVVRVSNLLRRSRGYGSHITAGSGANQLQVDLKTREARVGDDLISLTPKEFDILSSLVANAGRLMTREQLSGGAADDGGPASRALDVHVAHLRSKLRGAGLPDVITTVLGQGYRFES